MLSPIKNLRQLSLAFTVSAFCCVLQVKGQAKTAPAQPPARGSILFTVIDQEGHSLDTLKTEDVRVFEGDKEQQIISFQRLDDPPLSLAFLIDASRSQESTLPNQKLAANAFVQKIM